jgi:hypothetical protein
VLVYFHLLLVPQVNCIEEKSIRIFLFKYIYLFSAVTHQAGNNSITIQNSIVIGAITPNDCSDVPDSTTVSAQYNGKAIPLVSQDSSADGPGSRVGISFPTFSLDNMMPRHPWTSIGAYPCGKF